MKFFSKNLKVIISLLLIVAVVASISACGSSKPVEESSSSSEEISSSSEPESSSSESESVPEQPKPENAPTESFLPKIMAAYDKNADVVGWLYIPNTDINEEVVQAPDNDYYLRRNTAKSYDWYGCYFADYESILTNGKLSRNTIIYGHSMDDNPDGLKFSQLKKWLNIDFAQENPYIYFSTPEKDMVWKIFSVMYTSTKFNYVAADPNNTTFLNIINEAKKASQFNYDVDVNATDNILTLSTCTYVYGKENKTQRFVIMARLVRPGEEMPSTITLEKNPSPKQPTL